MARRGRQLKNRLEVVVHGVAPGSLSPNPNNPRRNYLDPDQDPDAFADLPWAADGRDRRAREGRWNGGPVFGYHRDAEGIGILEVIPEQARIVREHMFEKILELGSVRAIARHLDDLEIRVPVHVSRVGKTTGGGSFLDERIKRILINPVYTGKIPWRGKLYSGRHVAIVPERLFHDVQRIITTNAQRNRSYYDQRKHVFLLENILRCACGSPMKPKTSTTTSGKNHYYRCTKTVFRACGECEVGYLPAAPLEKAVIHRLRFVLELESSEDAPPSPERLFQMRDKIAGHVHVLQWRPDPNYRGIGILELMPFSFAPDEGVEDEPVARVPSGMQSGAGEGTTIVARFEPSS